MDEIKNIDKRDNLRVTTSNAFISARGLSKLSLKAKKTVVYSDYSMQEKR